MMFYQRGLAPEMSSSWGHGTKRTYMRTVTGRVTATMDEFCVESKSWRHRTAFSMWNSWDECSRSWSMDAWRSRDGLEEMRVREENMRKFRK